MPARLRPQRFFIWCEANFSLYQRALTSFHCLAFEVRSLQGNTMRYKLPAMIQPGFGAASITLPLQWPTLLQYLPELSSCHQGTINLNLGYPVLVLNPDAV